jgi:hypothetical protein
MALRNLGKLDDPAGLSGYPGVRLIVAAHYVLVVQVIHVGQLHDQLVELRTP